VLVSQPTLRIYPSPPGFSLAAILAHSNIRYVAPPLLLFVFDACVFQEICQQWPPVTRADVDNNLEKYFQLSMFSPEDIKEERQGLQKLLQDCK